MMDSTRLFPPFGASMDARLFLLTTAWRAFSATLGCALAAWLAPDRPVPHALVLGTVGMALSSLATVATWHAGPVYGLHWYPLPLAVMALPISWFGGKLGAGFRGSATS